MKTESGCMWRPVIGVLAIGLLAFGLSLQGAVLHQGSAVPSGTPAASATTLAPVAQPVESAKAVQGPSSKGRRGVVPAPGDGEIAFPVIEDGSAVPQGGSRIDRCIGDVGSGHDDCGTGGVVVNPKICTISGLPCMYDTHCNGGGDVCSNANIVYLGGNMINATRLGQCNSNGPPCEYDDECPVGSCSTTGAQDCHEDGDCPLGETCVGGQTCDNQPCSISGGRRCTTADGTPSGTSCDSNADCQGNDTCTYGDRSWTEHFVLNTCSNVAISYCCDGPQWVYRSLYTEDSCSTCGVPFTNDFTDFETCDDGHRSWYYWGLPPGTYAKPIYAAGDWGQGNPGNDTEYTLRIDAWEARGACCTGATFGTCHANMSRCDCVSSNGAYLGDASTCGGNACLQPGACCGPDGIGCTEVSAGTCITTNGGVFAGPSTTCTDPACCPMNPLGADDCANVTPVGPIPVPGYATMTGDSSGATGVCTASEDFFSAFIIDECAEVLIDFCCSGPPSMNWVHTAISQVTGADCCDTQSVGGDQFAFDCTDGNPRILIDALGPGTYFVLPVVDTSLDPPPNVGPYTVHVTTSPVDPSLLGACCDGTTCIANTCLRACTSLGGTYLGNFSTCGGNPCDEPSACCTTSGSCSNQLYATCLSQGGVPHPGLTCSEFNCPKPTADECPDAVLVSCDTEVFGDNSNATSNWGRCSISGGICHGVQEGDVPDHCSCPGASTGGLCSVAATQCCSARDCPNYNTPNQETCIATDSCERAGAPWVDPFFPCAWRTDWWHENPDIGNETVWYKFVADDTSVYLATCNSTADPNLFDTALMLYEYINEGTGEDRCGSLVMMDDPSGDPQFDGCGEDECPFEDPTAPWFSEICFCSLTVGQTYYVEMIASGGTPGSFQLDIQCPCLDCSPGACCETTGNRCFDFFAFNEDAPPISTFACNTDSECVGEVGTGGLCVSAGDCLCLPYYICTDAVEDFECPTDPASISSRYGGNGTTCDPQIGLPQISPACGTGACCFGNTCDEPFTPLGCLGDIGQGQSWNSEGSECVSGVQNLECPKACTLDGFDHPNDAGTVFLADSTSNGICELGLAPCSTDGMCVLPGEVCVGENTQIVSDSFVPLATPINELCWWGIYWDESQTDCSAAVITAGASNFTIRFLEDSDCDGLPDTSVAGGTFTNVPVSRSGSGNNLGANFEWEFHHSFAGVAVVPGTCYFVEITATNSPGNCDFWIETSTVGDGSGAVDNDADGAYDSGTNFDLAWIMDVTVNAADCVPDNDDCEDVITNGAGTTGLSGVIEVFANTFASDDGVAHPKNECGVSGLGPWKVRNELWYRYTAECSGLLTVDICSSGFDTGLVVYNLGGDPWTCPVDGTYKVGCTDDDCGTNGTRSLIVDIPVAQGDKILIKVGGDGSASVGCGLMKLTLDLGTNGCLDNSDCPDDGQFCNGNEFCDLSACQCAHTGDPCVPPLTCDETGDVCLPPGGGTCGIVGVESCFNHGGACGIMCLPIDCTTCGSVEPRLQLGTPPTLVLDLGTCGCNSASVAVSCAPNAYGGSASVDCTTNGAVVTFSGTLPDQSCCTLTFTGDIVDVRTLAMLETDVNFDCAVTSADAASVKARLGTPANAPDPFGGAQYDVNRDCNITSSDFASVKSRLGRVGPQCPCP